MIKLMKIIVQFILPKQKLTQIAGWCANQKIAGLTQLLIKLFATFYKINMAEAKESNIYAYATFNEFFTRQLKENMRPIVKGNNTLAITADGIINQVGSIIDNQLLQAKGHYYSLTALLAGNSILANRFRNGLFINTYLSPHNYHRVHMPCDGILTEMTYVPGTLFSVNKIMSNNIHNLFTRNERLICVFDTKFGKVAQILIGAMFVGSIATSWYGCTNRKREKIIKHWYYRDNDNDTVYLKKGEEMGTFKLGSTVINLFEPNYIKFNSLLEKGTLTKVGELLAEAI